MNLFDVPQTVSLVHCVSEDFRMSSGIAVDFKTRFGRVPELLQQHCISGSVAFLQDPPENSKRMLFYLVTKVFCTDKPRIECLRSSLQKLRSLCEQHAVRHLAMPMIGCGKDQLSWILVKEALMTTFAGTDISILICKFHGKVCNVIIYLFIHNIIQ
jgi:O-acetyl-ADP-ribose deacetylase (regulator of RNase III)